MLVSKRSIGGTKKGGPFIQGRRLCPSPEVRSISSWVLENSKVEFVFNSCPITGLYLHSWTRKGTGVVYTNKSRALWSINVRKNTQVNGHNKNDIVTSRYEVYPTKQYCEYPGQVPKNSGGTKSFTFVWRGVNYDTVVNHNTADVFLTVSLEPTGDYVDFNLQLKARQSYPVGGSAEDHTSVTVSSVNTPTFILKKSSTEAENKNRILSVPLLEGYTYRNPNKYLRSPRFTNESFQYNGTATRSYLPGQPPTISPKASTVFKRANFGSPGWMSMPLIIWGNREDKAGFMVYAIDPDGVHSKGWQWYADDSNVIIKAYDISDHEIDPNGIGGKV